MEELALAEAEDKMKRAFAIQMYGFLINLSEIDERDFPPLGIFDYDSDEESAQAERFDNTYPKIFATENMANQNRKFIIGLLESFLIPELSDLVVQYDDFNPYTIDCLPVNFEFRDNECPEISGEHLLAVGHILNEGEGRFIGVLTLPDTSEDVKCAINRLQMIFPDILEKLKPRIFTWYSHRCDAQHESSII